MRATCPRRIGVPFLRATMMLAKSCGWSMRASTCTTRSRSSLLRVPTGRSWLSLRTALVICSALTPRDSMAEGSRWMLMARRVPPTSVTEPTPRTFSKRFLRVCSAQVVSSTGLGAGLPAGKRLASGKTATDQIERLEGSKRKTRGSLTSTRNAGRNKAIFSRTSSAALRPSTCNWNSIMTTDEPS